MTTAIKFCGLTRADDVRVAVELGASFVGAVFAGGPRAMTPQQARSLFQNVNTSRRVGVFGDQAPDAIARIADAASLDVVQLHGDPTSEVVSAVKRATGLETWAAMRIAKTPTEAELDAIISSADAIVFDSRVSGSLGGTGRSFDWTLITTLLDQHRRAAARVVLAGGLTPALAPVAIAVVRPDIIDVSSGVESAPGVKDHGLMRAFAAAVRQAS
jgi:phosphoribosylanthranilate isomerase